MASRNRRNGGRNNQKQRSKQIHAKRQDQRLVKRQSFLKLVRNTIEAVEIYVKACSEGKSESMLKEINNNLNLQMLLLKTCTVERTRSGSKYAAETIEMGLSLSDKFKEKARRAKDDKEWGWNDGRHAEAMRRMNVFADGIEQILIDPSKVEDPSVIKYKGPSGKELDRRIQEKVKRGEKVDTGFSSIIDANHKYDDMVEEIKQNPDKFKREHGRLHDEYRRKERPKREDTGEYTPAGTFNFEINGDQLKQSRDGHGGAPGLDGSEEHALVKREAFLILIRETIDLVRVFGVARDSRVVKQLNLLLNLHLRRIAQSTRGMSNEMQTIFMARAMVFEFLNQVKGHERMHVYAVGMMTALIDPSKICLKDFQSILNGMAKDRVIENEGEVRQSHEFLLLKFYDNERAMAKPPAHMPARVFDFSTEEDSPMKGV